MRDLTFLCVVMTWLWIFLVWLWLDLNLKKTDLTTPRYTDSPAIGPFDHTIWEQKLTIIIQSINELVELSNPHWRGTNVVTIPPTPTPPTTILSKNSGYIATRDTKFLPHLNGDPGSKTQNLKPKTQTQKPKTQICNLMLQWNYEHKSFDNSNTKLLPDLNADPRSNTQNLKPKTQKPKSHATMEQWT